MARTDVALIELTPNAGAAQAAATEVLAANDARILALGKLEEIMLEITALENGAVIEILPGDNPPALSAGQGLIKLEGAENAVFDVGPLTSARFVQAGADDGCLLIDTNKKIKVRAYHIPRTA